MIISCIKSAELALEVINKELLHNPSKKLLKEKEELENRINFYKTNLSKMPEIENRLYYKIKYEGKSIMKAVNEVADENYFNNTTPSDAKWIHTKYFKNVKKYLNQDENKIRSVQ